MAHVTFEQLTKRFGDYVAVNNLNLDIKDGEFLVFVGPSGCGKTTCLRLLAGLESITKGQICIGDRIVVMKDGILQQVDTPTNLYNNPLNMFVAGFIGSPAMNFFEVEKVEQEGKAYLKLYSHITLKPLH